jgi:hypothetical protein
MRAISIRGEINVRYVIHHGAAQAKDAYFTHYGGDKLVDSFAKSALQTGTAIIHPTNYDKVDGQI